MRRVCAFDEYPHTYTYAKYSFIFTHIQIAIAIALHCICFCFCFCLWLRFYNLFVIANLEARFRWNERSGLSCYAIAFPMHALVCCFCCTTSICTFTCFLAYFSCYNSLSFLNCCFCWYSLFLLLLHCTRKCVSISLSIFIRPVVRLNICASAVYTQKYIHTHMHIYMGHVQLLRRLFGVRKQMHLKVH